MPEKTSGPHIRDDSRSILNAKKSLESSIPSPEETIRILKEKGAHKLAAALQTAHTNRELKKRKKNPIHDQLGLKLEEKE